MPRSAPSLIRSTAATSAPEKRQSRKNSSNAALVAASVASGPQAAGCAWAGGLARSKGVAGEDHGLPFTLGPPRAKPPILRSASLHHPTSPARPDVGDGAVRRKTFFLPSKVEGTLLILTSPGT